MHIPSIKIVFLICILLESVALISTKRFSNVISESANNTRFDRSHKPGRAKHFTGMAKRHKTQFTLNE